MGSNAQRRREAREKVQEMRRQEAAAQRRRSAMFGIGLAVIVVLAIGGIAWAVKVGSQEEPPPPPVAGVQTYDYEASQHTEEPVEYEESPPAGGPHSGTWQNCGIYEAPINNENGVHSLEHGAVWITYDPSLPQEEIDTLNALDDNYLLVSPYPGLESAVVASAWNNQVALDGADDPRLQDFITQFREGEQTPEPGAPCDGGTSETVPS